MELPNAASSDTLAAIRAAIPCASRRAVQAAQCLIDRLHAATPGDPALLAEAYLVLGQAHAARREGREAAAAAAQARERFVASGDQAALARCDLVAGEAATAEGRYDEALRLLKAARAAASQAGDRHGQAEAALGGGASCR
jgi:tetratricopeptide (TPR) repeat protein